jgi:flavodoxin
MLFYSLSLYLFVIMKALVVYYSLSGSNEALARLIAERLGADIEGIAGGSLEGLGMPLTAMKSFLKIKSGVPPLKHDPVAYDLVVLASPVYAGSIPSQVRGFLDKYKKDFKAVAFASVSGSGSNPKAREDVRKIVKKELAASLELKALEDQSEGKKKSFARLTADDLKRKEFADAVDVFLRSVWKRFG